VPTTGARILVKALNSTSNKSWTARIEVFGSTDNAHREKHKQDHHSVGGKAANTINEHALYWAQSETRHKIPPALKAGNCHLWRFSFPVHIRLYYRGNFTTASCYRTKHLLVVQFFTDNTNNSQSFWQENKVKAEQTPLPREQRTLDWECFHALAQASQKERARWSLLQLLLTASDRHSTLTRPWDENVKRHSNGDLST